ncbi:TPA: type II toxin-antitoxin system RelE/ParE family toxin [Escherichia coli]|nr:MULTISPECIES: type II toxin-antitoxin system RelE/ParE family toxin [Enterobacteriaceae]MCV7755215.1 type II toxin-antitoxin system RelE/ParE family toxin [Escherichia coli]MCV7941200.1 type II toxin-antitoxin system RelE/ParE family toxin [Escherichia coli]MCV7990549.1 type II toxin-antitoxin system RelE/ParE family toxin [Escherichia coli]MCV8227816.1 type II toxin-antitoxin system RelE/ParE family toxin [Escherichia coli]MCV8258071.1 type II toxin-antitoxin system RelE/ParE family toxin 
MCIYLNLMILIKIIRGFIRTERLITATDRLADYPRLYETDERYGEGGRCISLSGQHVLYEVNDKASRVNILAVVGLRQNPRFII